MDAQFSNTLDAENGFSFADESFLPAYDLQSFTNGIKHDYLELGALNIPLLPYAPGLDNSAPSPNLSYETESPDDQDSDPVLKFLNQILIEENMEEKPSMFHDPLALRATEKSLYDVIGKEYPPSPYHEVKYGEKAWASDSPDSFFGNSSEQTNSSNSGSSPTDPQWIVDPGEYITPVEHNHPHEFSSNTVLQTSSQSSLGTVYSLDNANSTNFFENAAMLQNIFSDSESILQFKRGMEEARKFLPPSNNLIIDLDKYELPPKSEEIKIKSDVVKVEKDATDESRTGLKGRKHIYSRDDDSDDFQRSSKQSAIYDDEAELSAMFDRVLLFTDANGKSLCCGSDAKLSTAVETVSPATEVSNGSNSRRAQANKNEGQGDSVDLRTLLISCAQSVAADDRRTAYEQLKQIRQHSSPTGDAIQRLANVFASGLEARLGGTGSELYSSLTRRKITACEKLKAYSVYLSACPFKKLAIFMANMMIGSMASEATTLHIVDFGILYGFQWPILIQHISQRVGGPPKLRITGIELPQSGFKPAESVEETGRRLARYCERFRVPFEYQPIATQNWEKIKLEDLKIVKGELLAVNAMFRFGKLADETVSIDNPRDAVLKLIREMKPDIFVNAITNGSFSAPFFVTRFREALFHYSALFDMFDTTLPRDNLQRMNFEQDFYGREVINVIACEGAQRVERPETYKQWQVRLMRAGFKPLTVTPEIMKKYKQKGAVGYHKDFLYDVDASWMLLGWKGRILYASSCWVPS